MKAEFRVPSWLDLQELGSVVGLLTCIPKMEISLRVAAMFVNAANMATDRILGSSPSSMAH